MDLIEIRSINEIEMNSNTYTEIFNAMDCDNDFAVNSTVFQTAFDGKVWDGKITPLWVFTAILVFILWVCVAVQGQMNLINN
jgi:hypothetical protein